MGIGTGFLAGQTHEQAVVLTPLLLVSALALALQKEKLPLWYWLGILSVILGNIIVLGSPYGRSMERLVQYGEALEWDFLVPASIGWILALDVIFTAWQEF